MFRLSTLKRNNSIPSPVVISTGDVLLRGELCLPHGAKGIVILAHTGVSEKLSMYSCTTEIIHRFSTGTLVIDLQSEKEQAADLKVHTLHMDTAKLANRLADIGEWTLRQPTLRGLGIGYFGAGTNAAATLIAASMQPRNVTALAVRSGRLDGASDILPYVRAPALLIVGEQDECAVESNKAALAKLNSDSRMDIIPHAGSSFDEPGEMETAATLAAEWFSARF